jgi:hypothetical protein
MNERDINEQVSISLPLGAWNVVVFLLKKSGPWETVDPLLQALNQQLASSQANANGHIVTDD